MPEDRPPRLYTNSVNARGGPFEVVLSLGFREAPDGEPDEMAQVVMSWEHVKLLQEILGRMVDDYEGKLGTIPDVRSEIQEEAG